ncbi:glycosyltransferase [Acinetobacter sp. YH12075]|uniref:glycosyltransferase n=1 Tax=Acinetobacter sp. YH12075 TaxID=2601070 RepID=UPI0015D12DA1|nr:glycosyltransferase [Acinetobacter sp. YH12075]
MKIAHLTSVHPRNDIRVFHKECVSLAKYDDLDVSLIVADGKGDSCVDKVKIFDVGASRNRLYRIFFSTFLVFVKALNIKADIYHFHDPELIFYGFILKLLGKKVVFDIHEFSYIQIKHKAWLPSYLRKPISFFYKKIEDFFCKKFDFLVVPQEEMKKYYKKININTITAFNYPSKADLISRDSFPTADNRLKNLIYVGALSDDRGFSNMISLIEELVSKDPTYKLFIAGQYSKYQIEVVQSSPAFSSITMLGFLDRESIRNNLKNCAWGLILFNNVGQYYMANALKMFEYMSAGQILIIPNFGDWKKLNDTLTVGYNVDVKKPKDIADIILRVDENIFNSFSKRNIKLVSEQFVWESEVKKIYDAYRIL